MTPNTEQVVNLLHACNSIGNKRLPEWAATLLRRTYNNAHALKEEYEMGAEETSIHIIKMAFWFGAESQKRGYDVEFK